MKKPIEIKCDSGSHYRRVDGNYFPHTDRQYYIKWDGLTRLVDKGYMFTEVLGLNESSIFNDWLARRTTE
jgi:hypothetical protein